MGPLFYEVAQDGDLEVFLAQQAFELVILSFDFTNTLSGILARSASPLLWVKRGISVSLVALGPSVNQGRGQLVTSSHYSPVTCLDSFTCYSSLEICIVPSAAQGTCPLRFQARAKRH